jgi:HlyD family secretion protein
MFEQGPSDLGRLAQRAAHPAPRAVLQALLLVSALALGWSAFARLDIVAVAEGRLVPRTDIKIVQPPEGGVVREILAAEGQRVMAGQVLLRLDPAISEAELTALESEWLNRRIELSRLQAAEGGGDFERDAAWPALQFASHAAQLKADRLALESARSREMHAVEKARHELAAAEREQERLGKGLAQARDEAAAHAKLAASGYVSKLALGEKQRDRAAQEQALLAQQALIEAARAEQAAAQQRLELIELQWRQELAAKRLAAEASSRQLEQEVAKARKRREYLDLKAPQDGVVKDLATQTLGAVATPGAVLLTLAPVTEPLEAEVMIRHEDAGFVHAGQRAQVKFAAYPFQKYGVAHGVVGRVSPDATAQPGQTASQTAPRDPAAGGYRARVPLDQQALELEGRALAFTAGMAVVAEIHLGERTVLEYLLSPVRRAFMEAARER